MRTLNLEPFWRTSFGSDHLFDPVDQSLRSEAGGQLPSLQYRPHF